LSPPLPALVLLPGLDGSGKLFGEFLRELGSEVSTVVVPYPKDQPLDYDALEKLVRSVLPVDRRFVLLGESFSGPLAIRISADPPAALVATILCATFAQNPFPWLGWARPFAVYLPVKALPRWLRAPLLWGSKSATRAPTQARRAMTEVDAAVIRCRIRALLSVDESAALRRIGTPTLVLRARHDWVISKAATESMLASLRCASLVEIDGPHLLLQSRPAQCAAATKMFLLASAGQPMS
jgi:pimeloyl-ACP methyl ester carboxylesterase